jgi:hypothetical protein
MNELTGNTLFDPTVSVADHILFTVLHPLSSSLQARSPPHITHSHPVSARLRLVLLPTILSCHSLPSRPLAIVLDSLSFYLAARHDVTSTTTLLLLRHSPTDCGPGLVSEHVSLSSYLLRICYVPRISQPPIWLDRLAFVFFRSVWQSLCLPLLVSALDYGVLCFAP